MSTLRTITISSLCVLGACGSSESAYPEFAPQKLVDEHGRMWVKDKAVVYASEEEILAHERSLKNRTGVPSEEAPLVDPRDMSAMEYAKEVEPIMEMAGVEYRLSEESLLSYGATMRERAIARRRNGPLSGDEGPSVSAGIGESIDGGAPLSLDEIDDFGAINKKIIGSDDRAIVNYATHFFPFSAHAALKRGGSPNCTVFKALGHHTAVGVAHCEHTGSSWKPRAEMQFKAGLTWTGDALPPVVPANCYTRTVPKKYTERDDLKKNDYAVFAFRGGNTWCPLDAYNFGYLGHKSVSNNPDFGAYLSGYPVDKPPPGFPGWPTLVNDYRNGGQDANIFQNNVVKYKNDATGGQSGTALFSYSSSSGYQARAIHSGGVSGDRNAGRDFNGDLADFVRAHGGS